MCGRAGDIIHAAGVRVGFSSSARARRVGLKDFVRAKESGGVRGLKEALDFVAQILEVIRADPEFEHFFYDWRELGQRANRAQWRSLGGPYHPARRRQHQGVFDGAQGHPAGVQLGRQKAVRSADRTRRSRCLPVSGEDLVCIFFPADGVLVQAIPPQPCGARSDGPSMVTVWQ
jgi:hypothetical protein